MNLKTSGVIVVAAALVACVVAPGDPSTALAVEGSSNAHPSIAANGRFVAIAWGATTKEGATDIYTAVSRDAGRTFESPTRANDDRSQASLSGEQPPRVTLVPRPGRDPSIVVVWTAKAVAATRLLSARSDDGGQSFTPPAALPGSDATGNRGWHAMAADGNGHVVTIWLDHREMTKTADGTVSTNHAEHKGGTHSPQQTDGVARAQLSQLFFARLDDADSARALTGGVCYCCKTAIAAGAGGAVWAAWRHVYPGNIRDIAFTMSRDGGRTFTPPIRVSADGWELDGCPENGPAMAVDGQQRVHLVWPTLSRSESDGQPTLALFYAMSKDGRRFTPRLRIPTEGVPRHAQIAIASGGAVVVAWDEGANGSRQVAIAHGSPGADGVAMFQRQLASSDGPATYPVLAPIQDGALTAWTSGEPADSVIRVARTR